jgi:hypothetical protein
MSNIKNITVAYNPNDFHYYNATFSEKYSNNRLVNTNDSYADSNFCLSRIDGNIECRTSTITGNTDLLQQCYDKEVCINRTNAMKIRDIQTNHDGAYTRNVDTSIDYNRELMNSYNLAIGSLGILIMFYFLYE